MHGNPAMTFPIEKRITTEVFIDRSAALYIVETQNRVVTDAGDQPTDWRSKCTLCRRAILISKAVNLS